MTLKRTFFLIAFLFACGSSFAQDHSITGKIVDSKDDSALINVDVIITSSPDSKTTGGAVTDLNGNFEIDDVPAGTYILKATYLSYKTYSQTIVVDKDIALGTLKMSSDGNVLKGVTVEGKQIRAEQLGDTTQFHADAYKTNPDATAEDLVTKMPGITSDNSGVKVNGEAVQQVYVDGKPFFGTDPTLALKNLPAEVIDKIQVFDKLSDQAQFTGFDDGNSQKTINVVTKKNKSNGEFGKVFGGYGTDGTYLAGGSFNSFNGDQRISVIELSNNVNQQNFSSQDILGVTGGSGNMGGRGNGGSRGSFGGGSGAGNFLVGQQGGVTTTHSAGVNYSDDWGKKIKVTASYFFNYTDNVNNTALTRNYFTNNADSSSTYGEKDLSNTKNFNNRFNVRFEYDIDSFNTFIITPTMSVQQNYASTGQTDSTFNYGLLGNNGLPSSYSLNNSTINNTGYSFSNNILFQHKFHKKRRTLSINVGTSLNEKSGDGTYYSQTHYTDDSALLDQHYTMYNNGYTVSSNVTYTEPIGQKSQLMFNYNPSYTRSLSDKETDTMNSMSGLYNDLDTQLSNKYNSTYITQRGGVSYRVGDRKLRFMIGANIQYATLEGDQAYPTAFTINKNFTSVLPIAMFNYRFADGRNLRIMYRTNTTAPSVTQLQNVVNVSNPLLLTTGNPLLKQDYEQTLILRYGLTKAKTAHNFFIYGYANYINNYIGNATYIPTKDSTIANGIAFPRGSQLTAPVNVNGYWNNRLFMTYGMPADFIKSNFNLNGGINYTRTPGLINDNLNNSTDYAPTFGAVLSSNVSENLDFTLAYTGTYNFVKNSLQTAANDNYYNHTTSFKINWIFLKGIVLNTNITNTYYSTLTGTSPNESFYLWNAYVAYKFLKKRSLEARLSVFDLLNQNKSISRTVTDTYIENDITQVLKQYLMLSLTYTLRNFKGAANMPPDDDGHNHDGPPGGGGYHMHGGGNGGGNGGGGYNN